MIRFMRIALRVFAVIVVLILIEIWRSNCLLTTTEYRFASEKISDDVELVFLSDLHSDSFGSSNSSLIDEVSDVKPDVICVLGDMLDADSDTEDVAILQYLLEKLSNIAPTFFVYGNHDLTYERRTGIDLKYAVELSGAVFLNNSYVDLQIGDTQLRIGGMYDYAFKHHETDEEWESSERYCFLNDFQSTDLLKVLLCHRSDSMVFNDAYLDWDIDVILSGHTHGGIVRVPFKGGLIVTDQGYFYEYDYGRFQLDDTTLFITSGLDGYKWMPRFFNPPEIVRLTFENQ